MLQDVGPDQRGRRREHHREALPADADQPAGIDAEDAQRFGLEALRAVDPGLLLGLGLKEGKFIAGSSQAERDCTQPGGARRPGVTRRSAEAMNCMGAGQAGV